MDLIENLENHGPVSETQVECTIKSSKTAACQNPGDLVPLVDDGSTGNLGNRRLLDSEELRQRQVQEIAGAVVEVEQGFYLRPHSGIAMCKKLGTLGGRVVESLCKGGLDQIKLLG